MVKQEHNIHTTYLTDQANCIQKVSYTFADGECSTLLAAEKTQAACEIYCTFTQSNPTSLTKASNNSNNNNISNTSNKISSDGAFGFKNYLFIFLDIFLF